MYVASGVAAALLVLGYLLLDQLGGIVIAQGQLHPSEYLAGHVLAVEEDVHEDLKRSYAKVKLKDGEVVRASIGACIVLPGQKVRLAKYGIASGAFFVVTDNGTNDS